jgi:phosphomannomutase/phosphoglucomutase
MSIFKMCDIRGVYGSELSDETADRLGRAVALGLRGQQVVVGGDLRPSTSSLKASLIRGLETSGVHVLDVGTLPTPALYFARRMLQAEGAIMVTASHNPARYNGFKLMLRELPITPEELQTLGEAMERGDHVDGEGSTRQEEVLPAYMSSLCQAFGELAKRCIVVDAGNGSMGSVAPAVLRRMGQRVEELYCEPDGSFPNRDPNPAQPEHLRDLCARVVEAQADLGVAYDGDGDRVIFVDALGRVHAADRTLVLMIRHLLPRHPGAAVVYDLKSSSIVAEETLAAGGRPLMERSGHAFIKRRLLEEDALLGGEISGHYFFRAIGGDDALYATLFMLEVLEALDTPLSAAMDSVPIYPITPDLRAPCPPERAERILEELADAFAAYPISRYDGVRIQFPEGWALARLSVTEPLITLRFEAHTARALEKIQATVRASSPELDAVMRAAGF